MSIETGIPADVLRYRLMKGLPLDAPYEPRRKGDLLAKFKKALCNAEMEGATKFEFEPCKVCSCCLFYTSSGSCVDCANSKAGRKK